VLRTRLAPAFAVLAPAWGALALAACGYSSQRLTDFSGATTIAIAPIENQTFRRDLELRLTQAVAHELRARTSFALTTPDRADVVLTATMHAGEGVVLQDEDRTSILQRLTGAVSVTVTDRRRGCVLRTYVVHAMEEFTPGVAGESLEGSATDEWTRRIAEQIVQGLERGL
jgi:hypothetical protein